jgi:hypothetical protein
MNPLANEAPLRQIHRPSRATAIAFFLLSLAIAAFVIVWVFFLNRGTLTVSVEAPFRITVSGKQKECISFPCMLRLAPRTHSITIQKEGFYEDTQTVEIKRWKETKLTANFTFIPVVAEVKNRPPVLDKKNDEIAFLEKIDGKHVLKMRNGSEAIVTFERPFKNPRLMGASGSQKVLIADESDGSFSYYLVDIVKKSRRRLEVDGNAREAKWAGEYLVFAEGEGADEGEDKKIFAIHSETNNQILLSSIDAESVIERKPGILLFFSSEKQAEAASKLGPSISEAIEIAKKETFTPDQIPGTVFLTQFDVEHNLSQTLASIPVKDGKMPRRLTFDHSGKKIYFEMGEGLFEVILEK